MLGIDDPNRHSLDAGSDQDPSDPIRLRIHNTEFDEKFILARNNSLNFSKRRFPEETIGLRSAAIINRTAVMKLTKMKRFVDTDPDS
jgi:hypothetical protein